MRRDPLLTICIPTRNAEKEVDRCFAKLFSEWSPQIEVLVCDESTDSTKELIMSWEERLPKGALRIIPQTQPGIMCARKALFLEASGEFIFFCDIDDSLTDGALQRVCSYLAQNKPDLLLLPCLMIDEGNRRSEPTPLFSTLDSYFAALFYTDGFNALWSKIYKRALLDKDCLDSLPDVRLGEDKIWNMALAERITGISVLPGDPVYIYRIMPQSASRAKKASVFCNDFVLNTSFAVQIGRRLFAEQFDVDYPPFFQTSLANVLRVVLRANRVERKRSKPVLKAIRKGELFRKFKRGISECSSFKNRFLLRIFAWGFLG